MNHYEYQTIPSMIFETEDSLIHWLAYRPDIIERAQNYMIKKLASEIIYIQFFNSQNY